MLGIESFQNREFIEQGPTLPRGHPTRSNVLFPYMKNRTPRLHQLVFVTKYFSVPFAESGKTQENLRRSSSSILEVDPDDAPVGKRPPFLLCDDPGLGKSTMAMMVMAYRRWILQAQHESVLIPLNSKAVLSGLLNADTTSFSAEYNKAELVERKPILFITPNATKDQISQEIDIVLERDSFHLHPYYEFRKPFGRSSFYRQADDFRNGKSNVSPVVIMS